MTTLTRSCSGGVAAMVVLSCASVVERGADGRAVDPSPGQGRGGHYRGKQAVKVTEDGAVPNGEAYAIVKGPAFHNGEIEVELAGTPAKSAGEGARGFIGIAFPRHRRQVRITSTSVRPTAAPTIRSAATTRRNTASIRTTTSRGCARRRRKSTRATSISSLASGRGCGSSCRARRRSCSSTERLNRRSS